MAAQLIELNTALNFVVPGDMSSDPGHPNYGGSSTSIGEVGIDTGTSPPTLFDPSGSDDIMSYGRNLWISPYTCRKILEARGLHQSAAVDPRRLRPFLVLDFRLHRRAFENGRVELRRAARVDAPGRVTKPLHATESPVSIDLLDANARILATHDCFYVPAHASGCGCGCRSGEVPLDREPWLDFQEVIEWPEIGQEHVSVRVFASHPRLPRRVYIVTPPEQCGIPPGPVALSALLDTRGHGAVAPVELRWSTK